MVLRNDLNDNILDPNDNDLSNYDNCTYHGGDWCQYDDLFPNGDYHFSYLDSYYYDNDVNSHDYCDSLFADDDLNIHNHNYHDSHPPWCHSPVHHSLGRVWIGAHS